MTPRNVVQCRAIGHRFACSISISAESRLLLLLNDQRIFLAASFFLDEIEREKKKKKRKGTIEPLTPFLCLCSLKRGNALIFPSFR